MGRISETLYSSYLKERQGARLLESDHGFLIYKTVKDECFICDIFVSKDKRGSGVLTELISALKDIAIFDGAEFITGTIHLADPHATKTLSSAIRQGFQIARAEGGVILIAMKLKEE